MLRPFGIASPWLALRRAHQEAACRDDHHFGQIGCVAKARTRGQFCRDDLRFDPGVAAQDLTGVGRGGRMRRRFGGRCGRRRNRQVIRIDRAARAIKTGNPLQVPDEFRNVLGPVPDSQRKRLPAGQGLQILGQVLDVRHLRIAKQQREDAYAGTAGAFGDLVPDPVSGNVEATAPLPVNDVEPLRPDDHEHRRAGVEPALNGVDEIRAGVDAGEILEHLLAGELSAEVVGQPARRKFAIVAAVADEDARSVC
jgi:hypothetical protein